MKTVKMRLGSADAQRKYQTLIGGEISAPAISICSSIRRKDNSFRKYTRYNSACRDVVTSYVFRHFSGRLPFKGKTDFSRTRLMFSFYSEVGTKESLDNRDTEAFLIINLVNKSAGWSKSLLYSVDAAEICGGKTTSYYISSSKNWLRSTHILSLYILLLRAAFRGHWKSCETFDEMVALAHSRNENPTDLFADKDNRYINEHVKLWPLMITRFNELYKDFPMVRNYSIDAIINDDMSNDIKDIVDRLNTQGVSEEEINKTLLAYYLNEGMDKLCTGATVDRQLFKRLKSLAE